MISRFSFTSSQRTCIFLEMIKWQVEGMQIRVLKEAVRDHLSQY